MCYACLKNRFTGETFKVPTHKTGDWYGPSNRASDGEPMYEPVPLYLDSNPKIDLFNGGQYLASTNQFRNIRDALQYFKTRPIMGMIANYAKRDTRC